MNGRGIVVAVGGNALSPEGEVGTIEEQFLHTRQSLGAVVELARQGWRIALVHGNGPQVGNELLRNESARETIPPLPLGVLVAATEGWIGYMLQQSLQNALRESKVERQIVTLVTQVRVSADDPTLAEPSKPIGRTMREETARKLADELGWSVMATRGGWRRVVPSPQPIEIVESDMIRALVAAGHLVIAAGGGGTPVYATQDGMLEGVNAVIDKDRAAAILGLDIGAEVLMILTDVDAVYRGFGTPAETPLSRITAAEARALLEAGELGTGSMGPKVEAAVRFLDGGGKRAIIAGLDDARAAVEGTSGTTIVPDDR